MEAIEKAIEEFRQKQLAVYRADQERIVRDTRGAERAIRDHTGRWLFELLQNSDDAEASEVCVLVEDGAIYVADNGRGLKPKAVSAICGTDLSDKTTSTIGRKGVGFKAVYEVSRNPQVLTIDGGGIEFSPGRAEAWLRQNGFDDGDVPYPWTPFFVSWSEARQGDHVLDSLVNYKTVVRLPIVPHIQEQRVRQLFKEWPPHALFAFRHVREIHAPELEIALIPGDGVWSMRDSRGQTPASWRVARHTECPPAELLNLLGKDERKAILKDGVSFLIAAPLENDCVAPTEDYLPVHVFYPTEQKGPVRLLLHAEFLVKSDRTALMPIDGSPFNAWVAERLARHVCEFVNGSYRPDKPSGRAALLVPFGDRASHPVAEDLWQRIADKAQADLRLADVEGRQRLTVGEATLISVSVRPDLARTLLEAMSVRGQLLHPAFDEEKEARKALRELGCKEIHDQDLMAGIAENADSLAADTKWVWACWEWLAAWVGKEPYEEEHMERIRRVRALPIVPVDGRLLKASGLGARIVTWKPGGEAQNLPDWLPLTFVDEWFRDRIQTVTDPDPSVKKLCGELGIKEPGADVIQRAVGQAIEQYWKDNQGDPERFLRFIMTQDWHETSVVSQPLKRCPVPLSQPVRGEAWAGAGKAYFGREWGNDLLGDLYASIETVACVASDDAGGDKEKRCRVLVWLGVAHCPRIVEECHQSSVWRLPEGCGEWKQYLEIARDYCGRRVERIGSVPKMDHLAVGSLDQRQAPLLIRLVAQYWAAYYRDLAEVTAKGTQGREKNYRPWQVKAKWWWEVCERLPLPRRDGGAEHVALTALWLPDKRTARAIGDLLPVIDPDAFGNDRDTVRDWLVSAGGLRTRIEQVTVEEWKELLSTRMPDKAPAERLVSDERLRDRVTGWYAACLETVPEQENISEKAFASCPLLCRKGDSWRYMAEEPRYLNDDNDLAMAFAGDVWLFHAPDRLTTDAVKYLGVLRLSKAVEVQVTPGEPKSPLSDGLLARFNESLPYVWVWRSSQSKQATDRLSARLKGLKVHVVPALKANLALDGVHHEVERPWHVTDDIILLHRDHANESELAQAFAKAVGVRSEADFYENLLRCSDDHQRKEKLLSKGIADVEVERCLREYSGRPDVEEQEQKEPRTEQTRQKDTTGKLPSAPGGETSQQNPVAVEEKGKTPDKPPDTRKPPLRLKDASKVDYILGSPPEPGVAPSSSGRGGGTGQEGHSLTDKEKAELEEAGRCVAARELEKMGYAVKKMPQENPGFDLRGRKGGEELRVEVKAHLGRATVVDVTQRQYNEYLGQQGYHWELWNVEHLTENDTEPVAITRYDDIPDDAPHARTFRVDLKKCQSPGSPSVETPTSRLRPDL